MIKFEIEGLLNAYAGAVAETYHYEEMINHITFRSRRDENGKFETLEKECEMVSLLKDYLAYARVCGRKAVRIQSQLNEIGVSNDYIYDYIYKTLGIA